MLADSLTRRRLLAGATGMAGAALLAACGGGGPGTPAARAAATRKVTTPLGTYDIPAAPQRVVAIDARLDLEPAVALGLPLIGYTYDRAKPWVPVGAEVPWLSAKPNVEQIMSLRPDLIVCLNHESEFWPVAKLRKIAPVLPTDSAVTWRENLTRLATWLAVPDRLATAEADYDALLAQVRQRHGDLISTAKVAAISYLADEATVYVTSTRRSDQGLLPAETTLTDLGGSSPDGKLFSMAENGLSSEQLDRIADCQGFMITGSKDAYDALMANPLWLKLPAVKAGKVTLLEGDIYHGGCYTVRKAIEGWDALFTKLKEA
ncbi:ABC transporter substrate-binding protein [Nonomuraea sp. NPDC046570]|uniref:ABC transporter substrate-binding protein n=1 Tax=Nonomuraea sp. NPDC046570 TaxID=3155255 RepID=UPI003402EBC4